MLIDSTRKLVNFTLELTYFVYFIEICKRLIDGEKLLLILSENEEIKASLSLALMTLAVLIIVLIGEKISKLNHD